MGFLSKIKKKKTLVVGKLEIGAVLKVEVERQLVYAPTGGHVATHKISRRTLEIMESPLIKLDGKTMSASNWEELVQKGKSGWSPSDDKRVSFETGGWPGAKPLRYLLIKIL